MRLNRYIAQHTDLSRRKADELIAAGKVSINRQIAHVGTEVSDKDIVVVDGKKLEPIDQKSTVLLLHKPVEYVCSRDGQGSLSVYDLLPMRFQILNIAGRLDKDSSGLVVLTNDGMLLNELTHPSNDKQKVYRVTLTKPLEDGAIAQFAKGVDIGDKHVSKMSVLPNSDGAYIVTIHEGRNRQIRRTFEAAGYGVTSLHRTHLGPYEIGSLVPKQYKLLD